MDILEKKGKSEYDGELRNIISKLKFKNNPIEFKGSSALKSQTFYSDIDLFSSITGEISDKEVYEEINRILENIKNMNNVYFIELKIENSKGEKFKYFKNDPFKEEKFLKEFKDRNFIKIDLITFINYKFMELSIIYQFKETTLSSKEYISDLKEDIKELKKEKNYYKALKRYFNIYKTEGNIEKLLFLNEIFNSDLGEIYQKISNLEAIEKIKENYNDKLTKNRININLKDIDEPQNLKSISKNRKKYFNILNKHTFPLFEEISSKS